MRNFYNAYKTIHGLQIRSNAILVYYDLCRRTNRENECWPSKQTISKACHISVSTVTRSLRELEDVGMIVTVYRFRSENNRQTSNCYKIYETPQHFTNPEYPEVNQTEAPKQEDLFENPRENTPAAAQTLSEKNAACPKVPSEGPVSSESIKPSNLPLVKESIPAEPTTAKQHILRPPTAVRSQILFIRLLLYSLSAKIDTLPHVTVTPQGTKPGMKVTDNLRNISIFSKLTKWYKERQQKKDAGKLCCPAKNE